MEEVEVRDRFRDLYGYPCLVLFAVTNTLENVASTTNCCFICTELFISSKIGLRESPCGVVQRVVQMKACRHARTNEDSSANNFYNLCCPVRDGKSRGALEELCHACNTSPCTAGPPLQLPSTWARPTGPSPISFLLQEHQPLSVCSPDYTAELVVARGPRQAASVHCHSVCSQQGMGREPNAENERRPRKRDKPKVLRVGNTNDRACVCYYVSAGECGRRERTT